MGVPAEGCDGGRSPRLAERPKLLRHVQEVGVLGKHLAQAKHDNSSEFIRELADTHGTKFGLTTSPDKVEQETLEALQNAKTTLAAKAPDELDSYRQFVVDVTRSVAQAAEGGETAESETIEKVSAALK